MELTCTIQKTVDTKKIQELLAKSATVILVGFPSGEQHVPTLHKNENKEYKGYDGEDPADIEPIDTADLARMLHYGTATIPARPFLQEGIESKLPEIKEAVQEQAQKIAEGQKPNWNKVGTMAVGAVQEFVRSDHYKTTVPNADRTIKYKGSDMPLIDGGNMIQSITFKVQEGTK